MEVIEFSDWFFVYPIGRELSELIFVVGVFSRNLDHLVQRHIKIFCHFDRLLIIFLIFDN